MEELKDEVVEIGFAVEAMLAIEGISYVMENLDANWADDASREFLLEIIRKIEQEPCLLGASPHIMCIAKKQTINDL